MLSPFANIARLDVVNGEQDASGVVINVEEHADRITSPSPRELDPAVKAALKHRAASLRTIVASLRTDAPTSKSGADEDPQDCRIHATQLKIVKKLGEGAFAIVEQCKYTAAHGDGTAQMVAVKKLKPVVVSQQDDLKLFLAEVSLMRRLKHQYIVEYIGYGSLDTSSLSSSNSSMFLVSELMEGGTLKRAVMQQMKEPHKNVYGHQDALRWCIQIAEALSYLHNCTPMVIHRDLKLENVLLKGTERSQQVAKLSDFGLVACIKSSPMLRSRSSNQSDPLKDQSNHSADEERWTRNSRRYISRMSSAGWAKPSINIPQQNTPLSKEALQQLSGRTGTYMYMAPEMFLNKSYNEKVDVFSFGVIMYELLHRYMMVFAVSVKGTEEEIEQYAERVANGWRCPLSERFPKPLLDVIRDAWAQEPRSRPSMNEIVRRLRQLDADGILSGVREQNTGCCSIS